MGRRTYSAFLAILILLCVGLAADSSRAGAGGVIRTIPSPIPAPGHQLEDSTFAEGMLILLEQNNTPALPGKFHKIDPSDGTVLETITLPFSGFVNSISYDGSNLWILKRCSDPVIYEIDLNGILISQFTPDLGYFGAISVNCEGDILWVGANAKNWYDWTRLFKMTKTGEVLAWYKTTGIVEFYRGGGEIDTNYPTGSNLWVVVDHGSTVPRTIMRLKIEGDTVTVADEFDSLANINIGEKGTGLAFDGEHLWHNAMIPIKGKIWCLDDGAYHSAQYRIEQTVSGGYNPWIKGQTFTPSIGIDPDPGPVPTIDLTAITFYRSHQEWSGPTSQFYLNIYDGDPVNGTGNFVGSSINTIDVAILENFYPMTWTFDDLTLDYTHEYWALVSSTSTDGGLDVYCGMRECGPDLYAGGNAIAGIKSDHGGYHVKGNDLAFDIGLELYTLTADPGTLPVSTGGVVNFTLDAGSDHAIRNYFLLGSVTGTDPGSPLPGGLVTLPLNWDAFTGTVFKLAGSPALDGFVGTLDGLGRAQAQLNSFGPLPPGTAGIKLYFAYLLYNPFDFVSNPVSIEIVP